LLNRSKVLAVLLALCSSAVLAQKKPATVQNDRVVLEQILQQTYHHNRSRAADIGFAADAE